MINIYPGIFNDAIGPVMRGPSSSHTAGSFRIGQVIRNLAGNKLAQVVFLFHPEGSLATTYHTQGSDIGLAAGLLGIDITDEKMPESLAIAQKAGLDLKFEIVDYPADHPNTYLCLVKTQYGKEFSLTALSTGGGLIEVIEFNGIRFKRAMDFALLIVEGPQTDLNRINGGLEASRESLGILQTELCGTEEHALLLVDCVRPPAVDYTADHSVHFWPLIDPVYPVPGYGGAKMPFKRAVEIELNPVLNNQPLSELAMDWESARSGISKEEIRSKMDELITIFRSAVDEGLSGTDYADRILGSQSPAFDQARRAARLLPAGPLERITSYIMAIMEAKSAMKVIIAAPTAGAAGGLPGTLLGMAEELDSEREELINAFLAAGLIGVFISQEATFAAEVAGCQAETGAGAAMAAAGLIELAGGTARQAMGAASIALQNIMGLVCDPVGNRVEIPCLGRNVQAGANSLTSANLILGGVDPVIPLSETILTMLKVGHSMHRSLRCTALGGLADTPTARRIEKKLNSN